MLSPSYGCFSASMRALRLLNPTDAGNYHQPIVNTSVAPHSVLATPAVNIAIANSKFGGS